MSDPIQGLAEGAAVCIALIALVLFIGWLISKFGRFHA